VRLRTLLGLGAVLATLGGCIAVFGAEALDPGTNHTASAAAQELPTVLAAPAAVRVTWGITKAPVRHRVHPRFPITPKAGILIDLNTGEVMWASRADQRRPIASLTKLMTALVVVQRPRLDHTVTISSNASKTSGSVVGGLGIGSQVKVSDLLKGMLIVSGNDAATALAEGVGHREGRFVGAMNRTAAAMGLKCTHYVSPVGLAKADRSCARDLAFQARAVLADKDLRAIVRTVWTRIPTGYGRTKGLYNRNPLMRSHYVGITGIKTGHTDAAGQCLIASAKRGNRRLLGVILAADENGRAMASLLDAGFAALKH